MKNALLIIASVVVGYGFAYFSASKKWAPFGKVQGHETNYSKTLAGNDTDSGMVLADGISKDEMKSMSDNYISWLTELHAKAKKGGLRENESTQTMVRGGRISASLLASLAKSKCDIYYLFGRKINSNLIYMILSQPAAMSVDVTMPFDNYLAADSATMCPCICPDNILASYPSCPPVPPVGTPPTGNINPPTEPPKPPSK